MDDHTHRIAELLLPARDFEQEAEGLRAEVRRLIVEALQRNG